MMDTGDDAWVPEEERRDVDDIGPSEDNALEGGADDDLEDIYENPGSVVSEEDLL